MTNVPGRGTSASAARRALHQALLAEQGLASPGVDRIEPGEDAASAPLSFAQEQLWIFEHTFPGIPVYNVPAVARLTGQLDLAMLETALQAVQRRHAVLRSAFSHDRHVPRQCFAAPAQRRIPVRDLTGVQDAGELQRQVDTLVQAEIGRPFQLTRGPLLRARLIKVGAREHLFVLTMHHLVADAWSFDVLIRELAAISQLTSQGQPAPLEPLPVQYPDYVRWQRRRFAAGEFRAQADYWRKQLADPPPLLELPTDRPRLAASRFRGAVLQFEFGPELAAGLRELGRSERATPFMVCLALFGVLLYRYTGQTDIVVGSAAANRDRPELTPLIGFLVSMLPIRIKLGGRLTFPQVLRATRHTVLGGLANQDVPVEKVVKNVPPDRRPASAPFFEVAMSFRTAPADAQLPGLRVSQVAVHNGTTKRDLTLHLLDHGDRLTGMLEYDCDLFGAATIIRLAGHYRRLASAVIGQPEAPVSLLPMLTGGELRAAAAHHETLAGPGQSGRCLHESFEQQARRTPGALAVRHETDELCYAELNRYANQLARLLGHLGAGPGVTVGICLDRSLPAIVALLGVLKAGAAYLPLDPEDPAERRQALLDDAATRVVITAPGGPRPAGQAQHTVELDTTWRTLDGWPGADLGPIATPSDVAYLLYTSGSTGTPKGVLVEHAQLVSYCQAMLSRLDITAPLRYGMLQPLTVDSAVTMFGLSLCTGGELHLIGKARALDAAALADYCQRYPLDCLKIAPAHLKALQASPRFAGVLPRRHLIVGGEAADRAWLTELQRTAGECTIYNHYGPTETTVGVLVLAVADHPDPDSSTIALGPPLAGTQSYVLDENLCLQQAGVPGELCIGGALVARGYHGRPELTAEAFVPDPFSGRPGARLYRTGDIVRRREDGSSDFLGRRDDQVKIRGFRVELGEISHALASQPGARDALAIVREDRPGDRRIVGYAVPEKPAAFQPEQAMHALAIRLPPHMLPSALVVLDALPSTAHGKVDRRALPAPAPPSAAAAAPVHLPRSELERLVEAAWLSVLPPGEIGAEQNFFEAGGHSLLIMRLHERLQHDLGYEFAMIELFQLPTIRAQAEFFARQGNGDGRLGPGLERGRKQSDLLRRRRQNMQGKSRP